MNAEIEKCTTTMKKMYLDQLEGILDRELWFDFKNEYEIKLNRLNADLQRHQNANIDYMVTGVKIPDVCHKANLSTSELPPEAAAQIVRETYASVTVQQKHVKMKFAEPFATIEKLIRLTKQGISEQASTNLVKPLQRIMLHNSKH